MQRKLLKDLDDKKMDSVLERIINIRTTHKKASISALEGLSFSDQEAVLKDIRSLDHVLECLLLQTCNRVEIYALVSSEDEDSWKPEITRYWQQKIGIELSDFRPLIEISTGSNAVLHLLRLSSGLESMIVGEDQILGQIENAFEEAKKCGAISSVLQKIFERAIRTGKIIRSKTKINKGAVSIGSVAVNLLDECVHNLTGKKLMIIGAGETGTLVRKALAARKLNTTIVANRTYERAVKLANSFGGEAIHFDNLKRSLTSVDAVIVATSAPHYVLTHSLVAEVMKHRGENKLLIVDLAQPRNVEESVSHLPNVDLRNIDHLRGIADINLRRRLREAEKAEMMIEDELQQIMFILKKDKVEPIISAIYSKVEEIRQKEVGKALKMMKGINNSHGHSQEERCRRYEKIAEDLSYVLIERLLSNPITNLRRAAMDDDFEIVSIAKKLFNIKISEESE